MSEPETKEPLSLATACAHGDEAVPSWLLAKATEDGEVAVAKWLRAAGATKSVPNERPVELPIGGTLTAAGLRKLGAEFTEACAVGDLPGAKRSYAHGGWVDAGLVLAHRNGFAHVVRWLGTLGHTVLSKIES